MSSERPVFRSYDDHRRALTAPCHAVCAGALVMLLATSARATDKIAVVPTQIEEGAQSLVPDLFDDYLLTAVQNAGNFEVIGQDDISALIGFEKQKDLVNCTDTTCMADIGGALGVDRIVAVRIARLGHDWVATAKLINIRTTRVENRVNEILPGNAKDLLEAVPRLVQRLFATDATPAPEPKEPAPTTPSPSPKKPRADTKPETPSAHPGRGGRIAGTILMPIGGLIALIGGLVMQSYEVCVTRDSDLDTEGQACRTQENKNRGFGFLAMAGGLLLEGMGAKTRANGVARGRLQSDDARGAPRLYWLAWVCTGVALLSTVVGTADEGNGNVSKITTPLAWGTGVGAGALFFLGGFWVKAVPAKKVAINVVPTLQIARVGPDAHAYLAGLAMQF